MSSAAESSEATSNCTPEVIDAEPESDDKASSLLKGYVSDEIEFRTPTTRDHRIPRSRSCPPAPRKPKPKPTTHKRKLMFEDAAREEVEAFFEKSSAKRRSFSAPRAQKTNGNNAGDGSCS